MFRKHYKYLREWKNRKNRKPLVIRGARQVGKTFLARELGKYEFDHYLEINFDETPSKKELFLHEDINSIIQYISLDTSIAIIPGKTLIFLDEIQRAPEVFAKLRYFFEKRNDIHVIAAGSLLDFVLEKYQFSMPVGRIEYMYMAPMDLMEYLKAVEAETIYNFIKNYQIKDHIPDTIHTKLLDHTRTYMSIGGMPAVIREYCLSQSIEQCEKELSSIVNTYRDDFSKYGKKVDPFLLQTILDKMPRLAGRKIKYSKISPDKKSADLKKALHQLELARILYRVHHSSGNAIPLRSEIKERDFKTLFLDIGLMMRSLGLNILSLQNENLILSNKGALAEQYIGQQWLSQYESWETPELYYWNREKQGTSAEVDFLFEIQGRIVPVEVKAGTTGSLKSLHVFVSEKSSPAALRFNLSLPSVSTVVSKIPGLREQKFTLLSLPLYMVSETRRLMAEL